MFRKLQIKLSLMFNSKAITTHQFQKNTSTRVGDEFNGSYLYSVPSLSRTWAEATPVDKDHYAITQKQHDTHHALCVSGWSVLRQDGVKATFNDGQRKTIFSHDEAIKVLKLIEKEFEKDGYTVSTKQPFKNRIYTEQKPSTPKAA